MNRLNASIITAGVLMLLSPLSLMADNKKEQQEQMRLVIEVLQKEEVIRTEIPAFLMDDQAATQYCREVLGRTDEQYAEDTARANKILDNAGWIIEHMVYPEEKVRQKLVKKKYDPVLLDRIYGWAHDILNQAPSRYSALTGFCDYQLKLRREALTRTMPEGQLVCFSYREYGSSRPTEVNYELKREESSGRWLLNGHEVDEVVASELRALVERHETYKCLSRYDDVPSVLSGPPVLGGSPSWELICKFEQGTITTGSENMPVPSSCVAIVSYLNSVLKKVCKNQPNQD